MSLRPHNVFRSCRRFAVGAPPEDYRRRFEAALTENAFREALSETDKSQRVGWCDADQVLTTTFVDHNRWSFNQYLAFAMRVEQKSVPGRILQPLVRKRVDEWCRANDRDRCPAKVKAEIKDLVEFELLQRTQPKRDAYPVIWNVAEGWVAIACTSVARLDTFRMLFHRTFGLALRPIDPLDAVPTEIGMALLDGPAMDMRPDPGVVVPHVEAPAEDDPADDDGDHGVIQEEEGQCPPHIASEWLLWLWHRADTGRGSVSLGEHGSVEWHLDGRIDFRTPGDDKTTASIGGDNPAASAVALAALATGDVVKAMGLVVRREDREYTLRLSGPLLHRSGVKLPAMVKGGDVAEQVYEAAFLAEELTFLVDSLFRTWAKQRVAQGKQGEAAIRRWLGLSLGEKLDATVDGERIAGRQLVLFAKEAA